MFYCNHEPLEHQFTTVNIHVRMYLCMYTFTLSSLPPSSSSKKAKQEVEKEEKVAVDSSPSATAVEGSIPPDAELWTHLQFARNEVQSCPSAKEKLERLGR